MNATIAHRYRELFARHASGMLLGLRRGFAPDYKLRVIHVAFRGGFIAAGGDSAVSRTRGEGGRRRGVSRGTSEGERDGKIGVTSLSRRGKSTGRSPSPSVYRARNISSPRLIIAYVHYSVATITARKGAILPSLLLSSCSEILGRCRARRFSLKCSRRAKANARARKGRFCVNNGANFVYRV